MRAGLLTESIQVKRPVVTTNALGEQVMTYSDLYSTRARLVRHNRNRDNVDGNTTMTNDIILQVRSYHDIQQNDIVIYRGATYNVTTVTPLRLENCIEVVMNTLSANNDIVPPTPPTSEPEPEPEPEQEND